MQKKVLVTLLLSVLTVVKGEHLIIGDSKDKQLLHHTVAQYVAIPFVKRVKDEFYNSPDQRVINALLIYDNLFSEATATITAGGINHTYVNLRMQSERGKGLDFDIGIYA